MLPSRRTAAVPTCWTAPRSVSSAKRWSTPPPPRPPTCRSRSSVAWCDPRRNKADPPQRRRARRGDAEHDYLNHKDTKNTKGTKEQQGAAGSLLFFVSFVSLWFPL